MLKKFKMKKKPQEPVRNKCSNSLSEQLLDKSVEQFLAEHKDKEIYSMSWNGSWIHICYYALEEEKQFSKRFLEYEKSLAKWEAWKAENIEYIQAYNEAKKEKARIAKEKRIEARIVSCRLQKEHLDKMLKNLDKEAKSLGIEI